jgi:hypothetical protein
MEEVAMTLSLAGFMRFFKSSRRPDATSLDELRLSEHDLDDLNLPPNLRAKIMNERRRSALSDW